MNSRITSTTAFIRAIREIRVIRGFFLILVTIISTCAIPALAADPPNLSFIPDAKSFRFDTGQLRGILHRDGLSFGLSSVIHTPTNTPISASAGLFSHYRLLNSTNRYGPAAWDWPSTAKLLPDGAVQIDWSSDTDHPFDLRAVYRFKSPNTLDLATTVTPKQPSQNFEIFLASYFNGFPSSSVYVKENPASRKTSFMPALQPAGVWQAFPRDDDAPKIITDGRWKRPPNPVDWAIMPHLAAPLAIRRDPKTNLTAVIMSPPTDCFAVLTPHGEEPHRSLYLCLLGRDLKPAESTSARSRLIIAPNLTDDQVISLYEKYLNELKDSR